MAAKKSKVGVWILCDQLSEDVSPLQRLKPENVHILMAERQSVPEKHKSHKKKLILHFASMRHFRDRLRKKGYQVEYYAIDDPDKQKRAASDKGMEAILKDFVKRSGVARFRWMQPNDYDQHLDYEKLCDGLSIPTKMYPNNSFINSFEDFIKWEKAQDDLVMENYYRIIRRKMNILMEGEYPTGGRWNYDIENRVPPMENMDFPPLPTLPDDPIVKEATELVEKEFADHFGDTDDFWIPVTHEDSKKWFADFVDKRLRLFGMYQDAMVKENWFMYHSIISPMMNIGLIKPMDTVEAVTDSYYHGTTPINSAEGYIRQVIGWREYIRGIYWSRMPDYRESNFFESNAPIPQMLEDGKTRMNCIRDVVAQTRETGYAHHIQRLMIIGNFCLLTSVHPKIAVKWFMEKYVDAYEWVVLPNVLGMILFADGGYLGTKPYAASANYIGKMSNYCKGCFYRPRKRVGEKACPFNFLYWNFLHQNEEALKSNKRMSMVYNLLRRKSDGEMGLVVKSSEQFLEKIRTHGTDRRVK